MTADTTQQDAPAPPVPLLTGTFALFRTPDDGILLVWKKKGTTDDRRMPIPPFILKMAASQAGITTEEMIEKIGAGETE